VCAPRSLPGARRTNLELTKTGQRRKLHPHRSGHGRQKDLGRAATRRATFAETYGWFTEVFDTADLEDAKTLLAELAS
jgi:hypothetical protein